MYCHSILLLLIHIYTIINNIIYLLFTILLFIIYYLVSYYLVFITYYLVFYYLVFII